MKCPFCNEIIDNNSQICSICGEKIPQKSVEFENIKKYKKLVLSIIPIFILSVLFLVSKTIYENCIVEMNNPEYKSIQAPETRYFFQSGLTPKEAIDRMNMESEDLLKLLSSFNFSKRKSNVFGMFLDNLKYYKDFNSDLPETIDKEGIYSGVRISKDLKILNPKAPFFKIVDYGEYDGRSVRNIEINYEYLDKTYSKYLTNDWKEYLSITNRIKSYGNDWKFDKEPPMEEVFNWIIFYEKFIKKYPNFYYISEIKEKPKSYINRILIYTSNYSFKQNGELTKIKNAYENFIKNVPKDSDSYKYIKEVYDILENNGWSKDSEQFETFLNENGFEVGADNEYYI